MKVSFPISRKSRSTFSLHFSANFIFTLRIRRSRRRAKWNLKRILNSFWGSLQWDQIGRFLKALRGKFSFKGSPNICQLLLAILRNVTLTIKLLWLHFGHFLDHNWATFHSNPGSLQRLLTQSMCNRTPLFRLHSTLIEGKKAITKLLQL